MRAPAESFGFAVRDFLGEEVVDEIEVAHLGGVGSGC